MACKGMIGRYALALLFFGLLTPALAANPFDGTWGGADKRGRTAQLIVAGTSVIGFYWGSDYHDAANPRFSHNGTVLDFDFDQGHARVERTGSGARVTVRDRNGRDVSVDVKKD